MDVPLKIGMGQILVEGAEPARNLARARSMVQRAAASGCRAVVLPECLDLGWTHPSARELAAPVPGERTEHLARAARAHGIYVVAGLVERDGARIYNAAVLISPQGKIILHHRKINELDIAADLYSTGDRLGVVRTDLGTIGVSICADNFPDSLVFAESMARMGAQLLLSPCAWAVDAHHDNTREPYGQLWLNAYQRLTRAHNLTVIGVSNVGWLTAGPWQGRKCIGCSLAVGPGGRILAQGPYGDTAEALIVADVKNTTSTPAARSADPSLP
jgi:predicted amidohydrolase